MDGFVSVSHCDSVIHIYSSHFKDRWLNCAEEKLKAVRREHLLTPANKAQNNKRIFSVQFVTTYTPQAPILCNIIRIYWHILQSDPGLSKMFEHPPLMSF